MKDIDFLEVITQVFPFVGTEYSQRETDKCPQMHYGVSSSIVLAQFVNLGMTIVTARDAAVRSRRLDLLVLQLSIFEALFLESGLKKAAAAAAVIVGPVGLHFDKIFLSNNQPDYVPEVFGDGVAITLANDLTGVLYRKLDLSFFVPVGVDF